MQKIHQNELNPEQLKPFLRLGKYLSEDFLRTAEEWLFLVREYGISKGAPSVDSQEEYLRFLANVHDGWKKAQKSIAAFLIDALERLELSKENEKAQHRFRNKKGQKQAKASTREINREIDVARRMLDVVLWTIFKGEQSTLRRLFVKGGQHSLSKVNILDAMKAADYLNEDPQVMALSTDMLSSVHVGDLIISNPSKHETNFVELKAGEKNWAITATAIAVAQSKCELFEAIATAQYDARDMKHYRRVKRQTQRNEMILQTIRNEGGTDHNTGGRVFIRPMQEPAAFWAENIMRCYEKLNKETAWAIDVIDKCVYLGVYSDQRSAFVGFQGWMKVMGCESEIFNLTDSFRMSSTRPLGATFLSWELQQKVLRGEILIIMCLDILKMIEVGNQISSGYLDLEKVEDSELREHRQNGSIIYNGHLVRMNIGDQTMYMGEGIRERILFDQQMPLQLLKEPF